MVEKMESIGQLCTRVIAQALAVYTSVSEFEAVWDDDEATTRQLSAARGRVVEQCSKLYEEVKEFTDGAQIQVYY